MNFCGRKPNGRKLNGRKPNGRKPNGRIEFAGKITSSFCVPFRNVFFEQLLDLTGQRIVGGERIRNRPDRNFIGMIVGSPPFFRSNMTISLSIESVARPTASHPFDHARSFGVASISRFATSACFPLHAMCKGVRPSNRDRT